MKLLYENDKLKIVAAFDFDGTLTKGDTLLPYLCHGLGWLKFITAIFSSLPWLAGYALGVVPNSVAKKRLLRAALRGYALSDTDRWASSFISSRLPSQTVSWCQSKLNSHKHQGHFCVLVSASPDIYLRQVAQLFGFDALICTELEVQNQRLTGLMSTPNCYGDQKAIRLRALIDNHFENIKVEVYAYGDSPGDYSMLRMADYAWLKGKSVDKGRIPKR